jgi:histone-lysine N-methyltransferase SETMAR
VTAVTIEDMRFEYLPHPPYLPDLASSDYHIFGPLNEVTGVKTFCFDEEVQEAVAAHMAKGIFFKGIQALVKHCRTCTECNGDNVAK